MRRDLSCGLPSRSAPLSSNTQPDETSAAASSQAIETIVRQQLVSRNLPGVALAITRGGQVVQVSGYGRDSNGRPVTQDTRFYIGSASKAMTAVAVMRLVEAGRI
jgi:CubicO group peptidase (beta-lactamase class C family)